MQKTKVVLIFENDMGLERRKGYFAGLNQIGEV